jgi:hypothetical protein
MRRNKIPQRTLYSELPSICPKPYCGSTSFILHEDGWQCLNCMKIIYKDEPLPYIANNHPERIGQYNCHKIGTRQGTLRYSYSDSANLGQGRNRERSGTEYSELEDETFDWFDEYCDFAELSDINGFVRLGISAESRLT